jgi:hypothetical protein
MVEETDKKLDELKSSIDVNRALNAMIDCLLSNTEKKCKHCKKVHTCSLLTEAVIAYRNQTRQHDPHG